MEVTNRYWVVKHYIDGAPQESDFELKTESVSLSFENGERQVIVRNLCLSVDPYQVNRMKSPNCSFHAVNFTSPVPPGEGIGGYGVGRVVVSGIPEFQKDDLVAGVLRWGEYSIIKEGEMLNKLDTLGFPVSYHVGVLTFGGLTAYAGFFELCKPKKGEKMFVSAASGCVGSLVGQYAKLFGCYVVGCSGSQKKVDLLKHKLGFDEAFNYKEETDLNSVLKRCFPDGIDIYFDNVGGKTLEAVIENMNPYGRVAVCGAISEYTDKGKRAALNMTNVVYKSITLRGFLAADQMKVYNDFFSITVEYIRNGKMHVLEDVSIGVETMPSAFVGLFRGDNIGKKVVQVADD